MGTSRRAATYTGRVLRARSICVSSFALVVLASGCEAPPSAAEYPIPKYTYSGCPRAELDPDVCPASDPCGERRRERAAGVEVSTAPK